MRWLATLAVCAGALAVERVRLRAGRPRVVPAGDIRIVGIPKLENRSTFFQVEQIITEKIRTEFIGRGKYTVTPEAAGADAVLTGEVLAISVTAGRLHRAAAGLALSLHADDEGGRSPTSGPRRCCGRNDSLMFRDEYELQTRTTREHQR